ncbi:S53 family peptidase [Mucilaginibacter sp. X4EP1]|uniref:S53 family peptidase n=1 Tax=Mucilaginibacter sp. X4EP1 TaxID=2723092 RepID=UPI00216AB0C3|nr:S53 family peptidase [Mucilaginibacter sp. X4EP1]MCS3816411.1 kumamolisin [Mucilaginibacter sp. X4EP1]
MKSESKIVLAGSRKKPLEGCEPVTLSKNKKIEITVRLRKKEALKLTPSKVMSHEEYNQQHGTNPADAKLVHQFLVEHGLQVTETDLPRNSIKVKGSIGKFETAFNVSLAGKKDNAGNSYHTRSGDIYIPQSLNGIITGVFGLDNRPIARPMFQVAKATPSTSYTPVQVSQIYGFPTGVNGSGQTIGIIELGGGFRATDIKNYFKSLKVTAPKVKAVLVDKAKNKPTTSGSADGEVMLDIEVAGGVAPGANIAVYFAPNTDQGFLDAITKAAHDTTNKPSVISISWGGAEVNWTEQALTNMNEAIQAAATLGITVTVAAGDGGSADGVTDGDVHVDFPASSPYALACGGTRLVVNKNGELTETVWNDSDTSATGGGVSDFFALPDYQANANVPVSLSTQFKGRGVPDVAADADPDTGYNILVDGKKMVIGGTSAVAPLMAGLMALLNQQNGNNAGYINPTLYAAPGLCRDIVSGDNITTTTHLGYNAGPGWDACSGLGVLSKLGASANA